MTKQLRNLVQAIAALALLLSSSGSVAASPKSLPIPSAPAEAAAPAGSTQARANHLVQLHESEAHSPSGPTEVLASPGQSIAGWTPILTDSFENFPQDWMLFGPAGLDQQWGSTAVTADTDYNPDSSLSAWPAAAGADAVDPAGGNYPNDLDNWMIRGPIDLSDWEAAELDFSLNYDIEEGDWLGFCVATFGADPEPADFDQDADCSWITGQSDGWEDDYMDLSSFVGAPDLYIAFVFQSDSSNDGAYAGAFVDEVALWVSAEEIEYHDPFDRFVDYTEIVTETFDTVDLSSAPLWKVESTPAGASWVTTDADNDDEINPLSTQSASPTLGNSYSAGQQSWLFYGPLDLSDFVDADAIFSLKYNLNHDEAADADANDWFGFCAFASDASLADISGGDVHFDHCDWWSDHTGDTWQDGHHDLTPFAGSANVYLAFYFEANTDNADGGVFVDELLIEGHHADAEVPAAVDFHPDGLELTNGDFANGLTGWSTEIPEGKAGATTVEDGWAVLTGNQLLLHDFEIISDTVDVNVHFTYAISTTESSLNADSFCVHLAPTGDHGTILADVGCWDASNVPDFATDGSVSDTFGYNIPHSALQGLLGQAVTLVVELSQNDSQPTTLYVDDIVVYSVGQTPRDPSAAAQAASAINEVANHSDPNEPNDDFGTTAPLACNQTKGGLFGDVATTTNKDYDVFKLERVPAGQLIIDIDAATLQPASSADSLIRLYDTTLTELGRSDDDGTSLDSLLVYDNKVADATYYLVLSNFNEDGPNAYYTVKAQCGEAAAPPAEAPTLTPPPTASGGHKPWTAIIYMNGEDQKCVTNNDPSQCWDTATYDRVVQEIEKFIGAKQDVMNVVALIDGPNFGGVASDVTRYVVQPDGAYTLGVNKWELDEINMGDPDTLVDFANWAIANYPADHYYLAVDDHGGGMDGSSWDHHDAGGKKIDDQITPAELRSALKQITRNGERKIDVFGFEACLMGLFENAYDLKEYVDYITFFQTVSWTALQYPAYLRNLSASDSAEQLAKRIIDTYPVTSQAYTFGLVDTSKLDAVKARLDAFASSLMSADLSTLTNIRNATQAFRGEPSGDAASDVQGNLDLWDFAEHTKAAGIAVNEATALQAAIDAAVLQKKAVPQKGDDNYSDYHGLSILYPSGAWTFIDAYCQQYNLSDHGNGAWAKFLTTKAFAGYVWNCGGGGTVQSASLHGADQRPLHMPHFLEPKVDAGGPAIYLPVIAK